MTVEALKREVKSIQTIKDGQESTLFTSLTFILSLNRCRNTFSIHVEAGHNSSEPEDIPKDLRCPLCLYHTKNKSNMIDHIVLHRGRLHGHA